MVDHLSQQEITKFLRAALECSVYLAPNDPGLTREELFEIGKRIGLQDGEIGDALQGVTTEYMGVKRLLPDVSTTMAWATYLHNEEPEYRNFNAFDFVVSALNARVRADGEMKAQIERSLVVENAVARGIPQNEIEAAITIQIMTSELTEKGGVLRFKHGGARGQLPSELRAQYAARGQPIRSGARARVYPIVKDVIERRADGRPKHTEPLDAFADELDKLGYGRFRLWWKQTVAEVRRGDTQSSPVSVSVLAAALVEGALTFVVKHARALGLGVLGSKSFEQNERTWRIDDLVSSAAAGRESAILDANAKNRAEKLIRTRQRIHAGRMLSDFPSGVPDLRLEEAREAKETAELVVHGLIRFTL
jgi:hypothetical protein